MPKILVVGASHSSIAAAAAALLAQGHAVICLADLREPSPEPPKEAIFELTASLRLDAAHLSLGHADNVDAYQAFLNRLAPTPLEPNHRRFTARAVHHKNPNVRVVFQPCWSARRYKSRT